MPPLQGLRVAISSIHGYGVFATRRFQQGQTIVEGDGVLYRETDEFDDEYALILPGYELDERGAEGPNLYLDLADQTRWINHSCEPNTEVDTAWDDATRMARAWWVALRDIEPGEELTYDYCFSGHLALPCRCGAPVCRGLIVDPDELDDVPAEYRHLVHPRLRRRAQQSG
jgi:SET domain-containing protein